MVKIGQNSQNWSKWSKLVKMVKMVKIGQNGQNCQNWSKWPKLVKMVKIVRELVKMVKIGQNGQNGKNWSNGQNGQNWSKWPKLVKLVKLSVSWSKLSARNLLNYLSSSTVFPSLFITPPLSFIDPSFLYFLPFRKESSKKKSNLFSGQSTKAFSGQKNGYKLKKN